MKLVRALVPSLVLGAIASCASEPTNSCCDGNEVRSIETGNATADPAGDSELDGSTERSGWVTSTLALPTGDPATAAVVLEKSTPREVVLGSVFEYQIVVHNRSRSSLYGLVVTDIVPAEFTLEGARPAPDSWENGRARWSREVLEAGEKWRLEVKGRATSAGTLTHSAQLSYDARVVVSSRVVAPALALVKRTPVETSGDLLEVGYVVRNSGTGVARNVQVVEQLPEGLVTMDGAAELLLEVGDLEGGQSREVKGTLRALRTGAFESSATVRADGGLEAISEVTRIELRRPRLQIAGDVTERVVIGRPMKFRWTLENLGNGTARELVVEQLLPRGVELLRASDGGELRNGRLQWNLEALEAGATRSIEAVLEPTTQGIFSCQAVAKALGAEPVSASATCEAAGIPALSLEVVDLEDPIAVGNEQTYLVTVRNQGTAPATGVKVSAEFEANWLFITASGPTVFEQKDHTVSFAALEELAPKEERTYRVVMRAQTEGDTRFTLHLTSDQLTRPVTETEATLVYD